ncbi:MAG: DNA/RNA nuclease SfsA [Desulfovibrio sp.]|jgi:sugar fermentation stimulation protein A|nr:DNA/RNA nuclease SfsA [Desulfovibrio sp.]
MDDAPLLPLPEGCLYGRLIRREKRFLIAFAHKGQTLWAHTNNSGGMLGLARPGLPVLVSPAPGRKRKLPFTLELVSLNGPEAPAGDPFYPLPADPPGGGWAGVNTLTPNRLLRAAFENGRLPFAGGYTRLTAEAAYKNARLDALLTGPGMPPLWVECKNVTLVEDGAAAFPDAVTARGQKHLRLMAELVRTGARAVFFYCVQRADAACFAPADYIDPDYAALFYAALDKGVEVYPFIAPAGPKGCGLGRLLPVLPGSARRSGKNPA